MLYTYEEIIDYVREEDVKFIRLTFCDAYGVQKNIAIMPEELERAFKYGISFDASAVRGFGDAEKSDLFLFPEPSTFAVMPWRPSDGRVARIFCTVKHPDGKICEFDTRYILKKAIDAAKKKGVMCFFGAEFEFYLFHADEHGNSTGVPLDFAGYMDTSPLDKGENVRREICLTLESMGIKPESSHHEEGPGQNEIDFRYSDALSSADNSITFKNAVGNIAARNALVASFSPKPIDTKSGNGMHINISPSSVDGKELFMPFMAGILSHIREMTVFLNPTEESYKRFGSDKAPKYITWSPENRSQLIRIPAASNDRTRIELRSPDPTANPYLAYALLIYAGLDGVEKGLTPPASTDINLYSANADITEKLEKLPSTLKEAASIMAKSDFILEKLPKRIIDVYSSLS